MSKLVVFAVSGTLLLFGSMANAGRTEEQRIAEKEEKKKRINVLRRVKAEKTAFLISRLFQQTGAGTFVTSKIADYYIRDNSKAGETPLTEVELLTIAEASAKARPADDYSEAKHKLGPLAEKVANSYPEKVPPIIEISPDSDNPYAKSLALKIQEDFPHFYAMSPMYLINDPRPGGLLPFVISAQHFDAMQSDSAQFFCKSVGSGLPSKWHINAIKNAHQVTGRSISLADVLWLADTGFQLRRPTYNPIADIRIYASCTDKFYHPPHPEGEDFMVLFAGVHCYLQLNKDLQIEEEPKREREARWSDWHLTEWADSDSEGFSSVEGESYDLEFGREPPPKRQKSE